MTDPMQMLLQFRGRSELFPSNSRYHAIETAEMEAPGGTIIYMRRRFIPPAERFALLQEHSVTQGDRLDNISAHYLGDPEMFWRLCDANSAMHPRELTETIGRRLRITLPDGIPGSSNG